MVCSQAVADANKVKAQNQRKQAIQKYYEDPNYCLFCGKVIDVKDNQRVTNVKQSIFCSKTCSARFNNKGQDRWVNKRTKKKGSWRETTKETGLCEKCGKEIKYREVKYREKKDVKNLYVTRKFCDDCRSKVSSEQSKERARCQYGIEKDCVSIHDKKTKAEIKERFPGYARFRPFFTRHANLVYDSSGRKKECYICGYEKHVDVCHVKAVSDFPDTALVLEISALDNLVVLCKLHHKEFDERLIDLSEESRKTAANEMIERGRQILKSCGA
jgi:hypothetical protein